MIIRTDNHMKLCQKKLLGLSEIAMLEYLYVLLKIKGFNLTKNEKFSLEILQSIYKEDFDTILSGSLEVSSYEDIYNIIINFFNWPTCDNSYVSELLSRLYFDIIMQIFDQRITAAYIYKDINKTISGSGIVDFVIILLAEKQGVVLSGYGNS